MRILRASHLLFLLAAIASAQSADSILLLDQTPPAAIASDAQGNLLVARAVTATATSPIGVFRYSPQGTLLGEVTATAERLVNGTFGVVLATDAQGAVYFGSATNFVRLGATWMPQLPSGTIGVRQIAFDPQNNPVALAVDSSIPSTSFTRVLKFDRAAGQLLAEFDLPSAPYGGSMTVDSSGAVYVTGIGNNLTGFATKIDAALANSIYNVTLDPAAPKSVAVDSAGNAYIAETPLLVLETVGPPTGGGAIPFGSNKVYKLDGTGKVLATNSGGGWFIAAAKSGSLVVLGGSYTPTGAFQIVCGPRTDLPGLAITSLDPATLQPLQSALVAQQDSSAAVGLADGSVYVTTDQSRILHANPSATSSPVSCITNGANFLVENTVVAGELITIFGVGLGSDPITVFDDSQQLPFGAGGTEVHIGGFTAPLLAVSDTQINTIVPYELLEPSNLQPAIEIWRNGRVIYTWQEALTVRNPTPLLSFDAKGALDLKPVGRASDTLVTYPVPLASVRNADGTINSAANPARIGSAVTIFATGFGQLAGPGNPGDGQPGPTPPFWPAAYHPSVALPTTADIPVMTPYGNLTLGMLPITTIAGRTNAVLQVQGMIPANFPAGIVPFVIGSVDPANPVWTNFLYVGK